ncbi:MAG: cyclodeaminase/cyclohydrolase family protein [Eubacterium sp.]|nr:cyclodeaminase/cyclohydrolase family protein [Candidatus Colimonas fimequi]
MAYTDKSCREFTALTASKEPVPGGGSVSALVGALGVALGIMVGSYTVGKKKYADVEDEIKACMEETEQIREDLLALVQADVDAFEPLSKLYGMKPETEEEKAKKDELMEATLNEACAIPIQIMEKCARAIELSKIYAEKGSVLMTSDAGASAISCKGALQAASLNVYINTSSMKNRERAEELNAKCEALLEEYTALADEVFCWVANKLKK